jgi:hypothetical protein
MEVKIQGFYFLSLEGSGWLFHAPTSLLAKQLLILTGWKCEWAVKLLWASKVSVDEVIYFSCESKMVSNFM